jgi:hypothetical protein
MEKKCAAKGLPSRYKQGFPDFEQKKSIPEDAVVSGALGGI